MKKVGPMHNQEKGVQSRPVHSHQNDEIDVFLPQWGRVTPGVPEPTGDILAHLTGSWCCDNIPLHALPVVRAMEEAPRGPVRFS